MSDRIDAEPGSGQVIEALAKRHPSKPHRMLMLVSASLLTLAALAVPVDFRLDRGSILTEAAAAENVDIEVMTLKIRASAPIWGPFSRSRRTTSTRHSWPSSKTSWPPTFPRGRSVRPS